jgi:PAS domain S-box-containing protein
VVVILILQKLVREKFIRAAVLVILLISPVGVFSQQFDITVYNTTHGLPDNQVTALLQDRYGRIWVGTVNGVAIYNGSDFKKFDRLEPVSSNSVTSLFEDDEGNVWIGMNEFGVGIFNGTSITYFNEADGFTSETVNSITTDQRGHIWFGTSNGLFRYDGKIFHSYNEIRGLANNFVFDVTCDSHGSIWASTKNGVSKIDLPDITNYTVDNGLSSNIVYNINEDNNDNLWMGTYLGITIYNGQQFRKFNKYKNINTERIEKIIHNSSGDIYFASYGDGVGMLRKDSISYLTVDDGLPSNIIKDIIQDREGNYWFGTWNGLCKYKGDKFLTYTIDDGLNNNNLLSIAADKNKRIWFGTLSGGLNYYENGSIKSLGINNGLKSSTIWSILTDDGNSHWFGTTSGPVKLDLSNYTFTNPYPTLDNIIIHAICKTSDGSMLFGTDYGIFYFDTDNRQHNISTGNDSIDNFKVRALFEGKDGTLWIGTTTAIYYLSSNSSLTNFNAINNLPDAPVTSIIQDVSGSMLFSTYESGVYIYTKTDSGFTLNTLNTNNGLYSNKVLFNYIDAQDNLWIGSSSGLDRLNWEVYLETGNIEVQHFDYTTGYYGVETNAACSDSESNIWFATVNGAIKHNTSSTLNDNVLPLLRLTNIRLFNENIDWKKKEIIIDSKTGLPKDLALAHDNNHLNFTFEGIYLTKPDEIVYTFKLDGFNETWSPLTAQPFANYSNLAPGNYTFKVKASINGRDWTSPVTYTFEIKPAYWKTPFFYFLYVATLVMTIFIYFRIRTRSLQRSQVILRLKVEQRTRELHEKNIELEKLSIAASGTDNAVLIFDENKQIEWANVGYTKMTGYTVDKINDEFGSSISNFTFNKNADQITEECINRKSSTVFESRIPCLDGEMIWTSCTLTPIFHETGNVKKIVLIYTDITFAKKMEEQIRESLEEKGLLLKEIHHRVKNNLQIIISLFNLQTHYIDDSASKEALKEGQDRIKSMALIHERFYQADGLSKIDFDAYIRRLAENLYLSFNRSLEKIKLIIDTDKISLDIDTAVPCGLIINELVSNSLKHGFTDQSTGELRISFKKLDSNLIRLTVSDNGVGFPKNFDFENADSLGIQLMKALTSQLEGHLTMNQGQGISFVLEFKATTHQSENVTT